MSVRAESVLFDPKDPNLRRDPYPTYRRMRDEAPAWRSPEGVWYFTRYADCFALFKSRAVTYDTMKSSKYEASLSKDPEERACQIEQSSRNRSLLDADPPEHTRLRSLMNRAFSASTVELCRPMIENFVDSLIDAFYGPSADIVSQFSSPLPIMVISSMMGIPSEDRDEFIEIGNAVARSVDPDVPLEQWLAAFQRLRECIARLVELRRTTPGDDLVSRLIEATEDGRLASENELLVNTGVMLIAGFETTTNLISNAVYRLLQHPDQMEKLRADPSLIRTAVEEVLRFDPPSQFIRIRAIKEDTEIGGAELHPGDPVVPVIAAANRDPSEFEDPETLDITRQVNRHLSFGLGHHLCIGAPLARLEAEVSILALLRRVPDLALSTDDEPEYRPNLQLRGFSKLHVTV